MTMETRALTFILKFMNENKQQGAASQARLATQPSWYQGMKQSCIGWCQQAVLTCRLQSLHRRHQLAVVGVRHGQLALHLGVLLLHRQKLLLQRQPVALRGSEEGRDGRDQYRCSSPEHEPSTQVGIRK